MKINSKIKQNGYNNILGNWILQGDDYFKLKVQSEDCKSERVILDLDYDCDVSRIIVYNEIEP